MIAPWNGPEEGPLSDRRDQATRVPRRLASPAHSDRKGSWSTDNRALGHGAAACPMQSNGVKEIAMPNRMDSMLSKGGGMMKGVKARLEGLTGVFRTLAEQHGEVAAMLKRLQSKPEKKAELWPEIRRELLSHERGEIREVYPVLRQHVQTRALAEHHDQE